MDEQYFTDHRPAADEELRTLLLDSRGHDLRMLVSPRVFSASRLDLGTRQLLDLAPSLPDRGSLLDLGCGWGPIAVTMALESPGAAVLAVDVNSRALDLTRRNARANGCENLTVAPADEALAASRERGDRFDVIWSNPPVRIGKEAMHRLLDEWLSLLSEDGRAYLVVQRNLGADSLIAWLCGRGYRAVKFASKKGYRIIEVRPGA
ncbi:methyltransferase [Actinomyces sp. B33]|uniref:class I SAM-dependent methyltransferase n=1 Tax=Actinomyces sp. B33 TaxID=2942131 RepID=UPI00233FF8E3|nr:methyltransferase [Actinomyces sp. B33]MDC4233060.1 methyltransferase [Actinomyces sp. B33]